MPYTRGNKGSNRFQEIVVNHVDTTVQLKLLLIYQRVPGKRPTSPPLR